MVRQRNKCRAAIRKSVICGALLFSVAIVPSTGNAQTSTYTAATDDVVINWNAIGGGTVSAPGSTYAPAYSAPRSTGGLLMPGPTSPRSRLYVAPQGGGSNIQLRQPGTSAASRSVPTQSTSRPPAPAKVAKTPAPAPAPAAAPAPPKAPTAVASAPAAPAPAPASPPPAPTKSESAEPAKAPPAPPVASAPAGAPPAPPPAPAVAEAPKPADKPAETEQASAPTSAPTDGAAQVLFNADNTKLSADGQKVLDGVIGELEASDKLRVQLMAYASGEDLSSSKARRISLSRALSVRSYLIEKGVRSTRIDVRALGDKAEGDQKNRVDVNTIDR